MIEICDPNMTMAVFKNKLYGKSFKRYPDGTFIIFDKEFRKVCMEELV